MDVSCFSFVDLARRALPLMSGGSLLTLSYLGSERVPPNYNVMGVAKAALPATSEKAVATLAEKPGHEEAILTVQENVTQLKDLIEKISANSAELSDQNPQQELPPSPSPSPWHLPFEANISPRRARSASRPLRVACEILIGRP
ncbi:SDR family oxidoreductase [Neomegalonema perideroedes]|uniref:SDR family oxidoreductase n=1 Tax=Neomegalonema perideroedes TaxID=217219 RepID=UPI00389927C3